MNFELRPWSMNDLSSLVNYANNPKIAKRLTDHFPHPYTIEAGRSFIERVMDNTTNLVLAISINGVASGGIGLHPQLDVYRFNAELGYWLAEPFWGQGIVTQAIQQMVVLGFEQLSIERIFARPYGTNKGSQRVLEKAGFQLEAVLKQTFFKAGVFEDEYIYAVRRADLDQFR